jgi:soluble cytochrome b562
MRARRLGSLLVLWVPFGALACAAEEDPAAVQTREAMHRIHGALADLLPASLEERALEPAEAARLRQQVELLATSVDELQSHAAERDLGFRFLSESLARDVEEVREHLAAGEIEQARYYLYDLTQNCVACHSRLPSRREFPLAERLTSRIALADLDPGERARLLVAVRRFDEALATWEAMFADPRRKPTELDLGGYLIDYLTISVRVQRDLERPRQTLADLRDRSDTPRYLRRHLDGWIEALEELSDEAEAEPSLGQARKLVRRARDLSDLPAGRERIVHDLVASGQLHRLIDEAGQSDRTVAEAFYLLGLIEARSIDSYWVPQAEFHLEAAVRVDPKGPFAEKAYAMLEEYVVLGAGATDESELDPRTARSLAELRDLIDSR